MLVLIMKFLVTGRDLVKLGILVNSEPVDALAMIIHKDFAQTTGRQVCEKLKDLIPRHNFYDSSPSSNR